MVVALLFTLRTAEREKDGWRASVAAYTFIPVQHSRIVQDALTFQWPAFFVASIIALVPQWSYRDRSPRPLTVASYLALIVAVAGYWHLIGWWIDARFPREPLHRHSMIVRGVLIVASVYAVPVFLLSLPGAAWQYHGHRGA